MTVLRGDCVEVMAGMSADSVDAIVCDPPYGLEFMGKEWDRLGDIGKTSHSGPAERDATTPFGRTRVAYSGSSNRKCLICSKWQWDHPGRKCECERPEWPNVAAHQGRLMSDWHAQWATAALRVAKPGAYLLAFGGTRTVHRMTCALEDAGWVVRDMLVWAYAQGFPKSRASLKPAWEPIVLCRKPGASRDLRIDECRIGTEPTTTIRSGGSGAHGVYGSDERTFTRENAGRWPANLVLTDPILDGGWKGVVGGGEVAPEKPERIGKRGGRPMFDQPGIGSPDKEGRWPADPGGTPSRFFMVPKAPRKERILSDGRRSPHPTQKPEALIRHLVNLVTPQTVPVLECTVCEWKRDQDLRQLRQPLRGEGRMEGQGSEVLLEGVRVPGAHPEPEAVRGVRGAVPAGEPSEPVLFDHLREPAHITDAGDDQGVCAQREGLHPPLPTGTPDGDADRLRGGASAGDGGAAGPDAGAPRGRGSHQRGEGRQPAGEPARADGSRSQQPAQASEEAVGLPELPLDAGHLGPCPACGGRLATGVRPGVVLDCFLGSGTLGVVCEGLGVQWVGIEREPEYADWAEDRIRDGQPEWSAA